MSFITSIRAAARLAPMLALPFVLVSCDDSGGGGGVCGGQLSANIEAVVDASADLQSEAMMIETSLLAACDDIITDLGGVPPTHTGSLDSQVQASCNAAATSLNTATASATVTIAYSAPHCYIDAQAQFACEADCDVSGSCEPGSIETRCTPGELSVVCEGSCAANAYCVATVEQPVVQCNGTCEGNCTGTCSGGTKDAAGNCSGTCTGSCEGDCHISGSAAIDCGANVRCQGSCTGTATLPRCETELTAPSCDYDAQCQAGCDASASVEATCTPAQVNVNVTGAGAAALDATLEQNLPVIMAIRDSVPRIYADAQALGSAYASLATSVSAVPACAAVKLQEITAATTASASAAVSINVSVTASASVSTSAN